MTNFEKLTKDVAALAELIFDVSECCYSHAYRKESIGRGNYCDICPLCNANCFSATGIEKWLNEEVE